MTLVIINTKSNKTSIYCKLFYIKEGNIIPIGFDGLETDYREIKPYKKELSGHRFVYKSTRYNGTGIPLDLLEALKNKFTHYLYIDDFYNGITNGEIKRTLQEYSCYY